MSASAASPAASDAKQALPTASPIRAERWLLLGLVVGLCLWWMALPQPFHLPNNDYYSFERTARSLADLSLPASFKRMPIFPGLMALVAPLMPGKQPYLDAARLLNAAFSLGLLGLLFGLAVRTMGRGALLPVALLVLNAPFQSMALQPLVEPSMGFFVLLACLLFVRRSPWQYAAGAAAALSRYEVGVILPALVLGNLVWDRPRWRRHLVLAGLACLPVAAWSLLGARFGHDDSAYLTLMSAGGFRPELRFLHSSLKQPFEGWYRGPDDQLQWFLLAVGLPLAVGLRAGWRDFRAASVMLLTFYVLAVALVIGFGIDKARYVYPSQWIALFYFALGLREIALGWLPRALAGRPPGLARLALAAALAIGLRMGWIWLGKLAAERSDVPLALDLALIGLALALVGVMGFGLLRDRGPAELAGLALLAALVLPILAGGASLTRYELNKVRYNNWDIWLLAEWIDGALPDQARIVVMHPSHVKFLTGLPDTRVASFADFEAPPDDLAALNGEMGSRGFDYAAYTFRAQPKDPSTDFYYQSNRIALAERFAAGTELPGFELVASIPVPDWLEHSPVRIYRRLER